MVQHLEGCTGLRNVNRGRIPSMPKELLTTRYCTVTVTVTDGDAVDSIRMYNREFLLSRVDTLHTKVAKLNL